MGIRDAEKRGLFVDAVNGYTRGMGKGNVCTFPARYLRELLSALLEFPQEKNR